MDKAKLLSKLKQKLTESTLTIKDAKLLGMSLVDTKNVRKLGQHLNNRAGLLIPYYNPEGVKTKQWRFRYLEEPSGIAASAKKIQRYTQPIGVTPQLYFPKNHAWDKTIKNPSKAIYITEGELKACCGCKHKFPTIAVGGVFNWKSKKRLLPEIPDMDLINWQGREVYLVFDADLKENMMVQKALRELSRLLINKGAIPKVVFIPELQDNNKAGMDDYIKEMGVNAFVQLLAEAEAYSLQEELWKLSSEVCYIQDPGVVIKMDNSQLMEPSRFTKHHYSNRYYFEEVIKKDDVVMEKKKAAQAWLDWEHRNEAVKLCYEPGKDKVFEDMFNTWNDTAIKPIKGDLSGWIKMMKYFFGDEIGAKEWFERWAAIQVQQPGVKLHSAVIMYGETQGTGKSLIGDTLLRLFGGENSIRIAAKELHSPYNGWAHNKQFVLGDEVTSGKGRTDNDHLKGLVTEPTVTINIKFVPNFITNNHINFYFTSNHVDSFYIEQTDRRWFIHKSPDKPMPDKFYDEFIKWRKNGGLNALMYYLLNLDLKGFRENTKPLVTHGKRLMLNAGRSEIDTFILALADSPKDILKELRMGNLEGLELWSSTLLHKVFSRGEKVSITPGGIAKACQRAGIKGLLRSRQIRTCEGRKVYYIFANENKWMNLDEDNVTDAVRKHLDKYKDFLGLPR